MQHAAPVLNSNTSDQALLVLCSVPDSASAAKISLALVERGLAACVHQLPNGQTVYRWQGEVQFASEIQLLIKTNAARYAELQQAVCELHPYDVPEIIATPIVAGLPSYLDWLHQACAPALTQHEV